VQKHQRFPRATFNVMEPNTIHLKELTGRRIIMLRLPGKMAIDQSRHR
jgi:hypothetical protein